MKSKIVEDKVKIKGFPRLRETLNGKIYVMTSVSSGTLLHVDKHGSFLGQFFTGLDPSTMKDFDGAIMLSND